MREPRQVPIGPPRRRVGVLRTAQMLGTAAAMSALLFVLAASAGAATWNVQTTPTISGGTRSHLAGVSCTSSTNCEAVGAYYESAKKRENPLAERWNGTEWAVQVTPSLPKTAKLTGVACPSAGYCVATGYETTSESGLNGFVEVWNGTSWTTQQTFGQQKLLNVACSATTACMAVGSLGEQALAYVWNGTKWVESSPRLLLTTKSELLGVSCTSATSCRAVGSYTNSGSTLKALAESWNGTGWEQQSTAGSAEAASLTAVNCVGPTNCAVAGNITTGGILSRQPVTVRWNGTVWTVQGNPAGVPKPAALNGVACITVGFCSAVGTVTPTESTPFAESYNGTAWSLQEVAAPTAGSSLLGVSCTSTTACTAVGEYKDASGNWSTLAERYQ